MACQHVLQTRLNRFCLVFHESERRLHFLSGFCDFLLDLQQQIHVRDHGTLHHRRKQCLLDLLVLQPHRVQQLQILVEEGALAVVLQGLRHFQQSVLGVTWRARAHGSKNGLVGDGCREEREGLAASIDWNLLCGVGREEGEDDMRSEGSVDGLRMREREGRGTERPRGGDEN